MEQETQVVGLEELLTNAEEILSSPSVLDKKEEIRQLKIQTTQLKRSFEGKEEEEENLTPDFFPIDEAIRKIDEKRKAEKKAKEKELETNAAVKKQILKEFQNLIQNEENIGAAFKAVGEIRERWKEVGPVSSEDHQDLQNEYSKLNELFHYNIDIFKELKEHDLKKNYSLKNQIVHSVQDLLNVKDIKTVEKELNRLRNEWDEIGGTYQEHWEEIKTKYWDGVKAVYLKINEHYQAKKEQQKEALAFKKSLIPQLQEVVALENESQKDWNNNTKKIIAIQDEWKNAGFSPKEETQAIWEEFRGLCDQFFEKKKAFFDKLQEKGNVNKERKEELIQKANELKESTDWDQTTRDLIYLQKQWKKIGHAGKYAENRLWADFRAACDHFFNAKETHHNTLNEAFEENLKKKVAYIEALKSEKLPDDFKEAMEILKKKSSDFAALGPVPNKKRKEISQAFKAVLDEKFDALKGDKSEKENILFQSKVDTLSQRPNAKEELENERRFIRKNINKMEQELAQMENNMGFFNLSKGSEGLLAEANKKVDKIKQDIEQNQDRIRQINKAIKKLA